VEDAVALGVDFRVFSPRIPGAVPNNWGKVRVSDVGSEAIAVEDAERTPSRSS
jgi:hypothetical protein